MLQSLPTGGHKNFLIYLLYDIWEGLQSWCKKYVYIDAFMATKFNNIYIYIYMYIYTYRVSQEEWARLREGVPYVKVYRYNPKHLCPKLNGYGDNGQRKVWSSGGSTHCTCQLTVLSMSANASPKLHMYFLQGDNVVHVAAALWMVGRLVVSHVMSVLGIHVSSIVLRTLRTTMTWVRVFL